MTSFWIIAVLLAIAAAVLSIRRLRRRDSKRLDPNRILREDALKQIHESEYRGSPATIHSLAGALTLRGDRAMALVADMEVAGLLRSEGEAILPTAAGRKYALRVLRAHRLWERHLADETGVDQSAWHFQAERREHLLTREQADELSARLGHPRYDPDGDPIPTAAGHVPAPGARIPLNSLAPGRPARVVHVEDEPPAVYAHIIASGLQAGLELMVLETGPERVRFIAEGEERSLAPVLAANVAVEEVLPGEAFDATTPTRRLSQLSLGEAGEVLSVSRACRGLERRRLLDLGIVPGTRVEAVLHSPSGDPTAYRVRGATIALRRQQADFIRVRRASEAPGS